MAMMCFRHMALPPSPPQKKKINSCFTVLTLLLNYIICTLCLSSHKCTFNMWNDAFQNQLLNLASQAVFDPIAAGNKSADVSSMFQMSVHPSV